MFPIGADDKKIVFFVGVGFVVVRLRDRALVDLNVAALVNAVHDKDAVMRPLAGKGLVEILENLFDFIEGNASFAIQFLFGAVVLKVQYVGHRGGMLSVANSFQSEQRADCIDVIWRFLHDNLGFFDVDRER